MAEIPVHRKKRAAGLSSWLIPLLALLILIPLLFLLARGCTDAGVIGNANNGNNNRNIAAETTNETTNYNSGNSAPTSNSAVVNSNTAGATVETNGAGNPDSANAGTGATNSGATITDASYFAGINNKAALIGRQADLSRVRVSRVLSDHVFTVKSGSGEMFAYLDENLDSGGGGERQIKIRRGQVLNLKGNFRRLPNEAATEETQDNGLTAEELEQMKGQQIYLHARSVSEARR